MTILASVIGDAITIDRFSKGFFRLMLLIKIEFIILGHITERNQINKRRPTMESHLKLAVIALAIVMIAVQAEVAIIQNIHPSLRIPELISARPMDEVKLGKWTKKGEIPVEITQCGASINI